LSLPVDYIAELIRGLSYKLDFVGFDRSFRSESITFDIRC